LGVPQALDEQGTDRNDREIVLDLKLMQLCLLKLLAIGKTLDGYEEPMVFTGAVILLGVLLQWRKGLKNFVPSVHACLVAQARGGKTLKLN